MSAELVHVAVAVIVNNKNQVLISKRADDVHMGGFWEFPGGKVENNESVEDALYRELNEELNISIKNFRPLIKITHHYKEKSVLLDVWTILDYSGDAIANEGQELVSRSIDELDASDFPAANGPVIRALKLPECCLITGAFETEDDFLSRLESAIANNVKLVQCRITSKLLQRHGEDNITKIIKRSELICQDHDVIMMLNYPDEIDVKSYEKIHLNSRKLKACSKRPDVQLLSASCHDESELLKAMELDVDFVFLSPVHVTASHPGAKVIGWHRFGELVNTINIPVYALGGVSDKDLFDAWQAGAQGVAAIAAFWNK